VIPLIPADAGLADLFADKVQRSAGIEAFYNSTALVQQDRLLERSLFGVPILGQIAAKGFASLRYVVDPCHCGALS